MLTANPYILIVDDDPEDRMAFTVEFAHRYPEIAVLQTETGREFLCYLEQCPGEDLPALLVLDYQMPDLNGPEVLCKLAANTRYKEIVKIVWSNSQRTKDRDECKRLGATYYFVKPGTNDEWEKTIRQMATILASAPHPAFDAAVPHARYRGT